MANDIDVAFHTPVGVGVGMLHVRRKTESVSSWVFADLNAAIARIESTHGPVKQGRPVYTPGGFKIPILCQKALARTDSFRAFDGPGAYVTFEVDPAKPKVDEAPLREMCEKFMRDVEDSLMTTALGAIEAGPETARMLVEGEGPADRNAAAAMLGESGGNAGGQAGGYFFLRRGVVRITHRA